MKRKNMLLGLILVFALSMSVFMAACVNDNPAETSGTESSGTTESTSGTDSNNTTETTAESTSSETTSEATSETTEGTRPMDKTPVDELGIPVDTGEESETESETQNNNNNNRCHPRYAMDDGYHWSPACNVCGKNAGTKKLHTIICDIEDEGDLLLYTYYCSVCDYVIDRIEVPFNLNLYVSPDDLLLSTHSFGKVPENFVFLSSNDGVISSEYISEAGNGASATIFSDATNAISTGKYLVMKIKLNSGRTSFKIDISSIEAYRQTSQTTNQPAATATVDVMTPGWSTVIIDVSKIVNGNTGYTPSSNGEYYLHELKIVMDGVSTLATGETFKIAYVGFCNTQQEARDFAKSENVRYIYNDIANSGAPDIIDGTPCNHTYQYIGEGGGQHYSEACTICKDDGGAIDHKYSYKAEYDENGMLLGYSINCICGVGKETNWTFKDGSILNFYSAPGQTANNWATTSSIKTEGGMVFTRVTFTNGSGSFKFDSETSNGFVNYDNGDAMKKDFDELVGGSGKYMVFKFRLSNAQKLAHISIGASADGATLPYDEGQVLGSPNIRYIANTPAGWNVMVIDVTTFDSNYYPANDESIKRATFGMKLNGAKNEYIDIAYFAVVNNWDAVMTLLGEENLETVKFVPNWKTPSTDVERAFDGTCIGDNHVIAEEKSNIVITDSVIADHCYTCTVTRSCTGEKCDYVESKQDNVIIDHNIISQEGSNIRTYPDVKTNDLCYSYSREDYCTVCQRVVAQSEGTVGHALGLPKVENGVYTYTCSEDKCKHSISLIPDMSGVNFYSAPGQMLNLWGTANSEGGDALGLNNTKLSCLMLDSEGVYTKVYMYDKGTVFVANDSVDASNHYEYNKNDDVINNPGTGAEVATDLLNGGCGNYAVLKIRTNNIGSVKFGITTDKVTDKAVIPAELEERDTADITSGEFVTYVIDISELASAEAEKVRIILRGDDTAQSGACLDVAYVAICEDWTAIANIIGDDDVLSLGAWGNGEATAYTNAQVQDKAAAEVAP